ncbi:MAG: RNA polymerase sigma factor [Gammaproteobacteria bacterium]|nr:RNA polymerase sigma factor [Gammaproteobacteria bacterium]
MPDMVSKTLSRDMETRSEQPVRRCFKRESVIMENRARIERFLAARVANPIDAQDLAQETFMRLLRVKDADLIHQPDAYLFRIAINLIYEYRLREQKRRTREKEFSIDPAFSDPHAINVDELASQQERIRQLEDWLEELPPKVRAALVLQRRDGWTYAEIAGRLDVSTSMVKKYLKQAISHCRLRMNESSE